MADLPFFGIVDQHEHFVHARVLDFLRLRLGNFLPGGNQNGARFGENLPRQRIDDRFGPDDVLRRRATGQTVGKVELFIVLVTPHLGDVVTAGIEEQIIKMLTDRVFRRHFAGAETAVQLDEAVRFRTGGIPFQRFADNPVAREQIFDRAVGSEAERAQKHGDAQLLLSVHADIQGAFCVLFQFQPCAAVGHDGGGEHFLARLVLGRSVIHAGRTDELGDDDALRSVDDERAVVRHQRQVAHEHFLIEHLIFHLIDKADLDAQRKRIRRVAVAALFLVILGFVAESVIEKIELEVVGVIGDRGKVLEYLADTFLNERVVAVLLNVHEIGNVNDLVDRPEFPSFILAIL